ncbi:MAG TPA: PAS domain S-box protein [Longimicrobiales bacterium]|nr:PAS domain S-box protein [Longimicrobiales bacterium]
MNRLSEGSLLSALLRFLHRPAPQSERNLPVRSFESRFSVEGQLALLVSSVQDYGIFMLDPQGHITSWNPGAARMKGYTEREALGRHFSMFFPREAIAAGWPNHELQLAAREGRFEDEGWRLRKDGSRFWASVVITALRDGDGRLIGFGKVTRDLTSRRAAEEELRGAASRLQAIVETAVDGIITIDDQGTIETVNPATERLFGYTADEMIGRNVSMLMPQPYRAEHDSYLHRYRRTGERRIIGIGREVSGRRKDGSEFPLELAVSETMLPDRRFFTGMIRDISERHRGEEALRRSEARLAGIIASAMDAIITVDASQRILVFNAAAEAIFRCPAGDAIGQPLERFIPPRHRAAHAQHIRDFAQTGVTSRSMWRPGTLMALRADGEEFPIEAAISQVESDGQKLFTVILRDITARLQEEEELRQAKEVAEAASRAKDQFMATMSHELRTPLNAIIGYADLIGAGVAGPITPKQEQAIQRINASSRHLLSLINQVLTFNRHLAAAPELRPEHFRAAPLLAEVAALVEPLALSKGLGFAVHMPDDQLVVQTDPSMLRQIVLNLLGNAVKYTQEGEIVFAAGSDGERLRLAVTDTGRGILAEHLERIWEPFWQADQSLTRQHEGVGLGLSVTRHLVDALEGEVFVASEPGRGSVFTVLLPLRVRAIGAA